MNSYKKLLRNNLDVAGEGEMRQEELGDPRVPLSPQVWGTIGGTGQGCDSVASGPKGATSGACSEVTRQRHSEGSCTVRAGEEAGACLGC